MKPILIVGYRDFGFEIAELAQAAGFEVVGFIDYLQQGYRSNTKLPVYKMSDIDHFDFTATYACAMSSTLERKRLSTEIASRSDNKLKPATLIHPDATISPSCQLESGCIVAAQVVLAACATLGAMTTVNRGASVGHHTKLSDFCFLGPGVNIGGNCHIAAHVYFGIGSTVLNHINIGKSSLISAGAVVTKNVPEHTQVLGLPAKIVKENFPGL